MSINLSRGKKILFYLGIFITNVVAMNDIIIVPIVNTLYQIFPNNLAGVNFIISGPAIIMFVASLLVPTILKFVNKKTLLSIACIVFTITSIGGAAITSLPYMILCRSCCGLCYGIVQVVVMGIITDVFVDEDKRASFMGYYNASMAVVGAIMGMMAGSLAVTGWKNAYLTYLLAIPMTIIVILFIPKVNNKTDNNTVSENIEHNTTKKRLGKNFLAMLLDLFLLSICYVTPFAMLVSVYVSENNLGNEAYSGMLSSAGTIGSAVICLGFGIIFSKMKVRTSLLSCIILTASLFLLYFFPNKILLVVLCIICGGAYGMMFSYVYAVGPSIVPPENIDKVISYITAAIGVATFSSIYISTALMNITQQKTLSSILPILGIIMGIVTVIEFINTKKLSDYIQKNNS